jgi:ketosteroid isomerase-like protein
MTDAAVQEVVELEQRRWDAVLAKDVATLAELFAEEMSYTHSNAVVDDKASYLKAIEERIFDYQSVERFDEDARRVGDTVMLTGRARIDVAAAGRVVNLNARYTVVWVKRNDRWAFLCWQSTSIPG